MLGEEVDEDEVVDNLERRILDRIPPVGTMLNAREGEDGCAAEMAGRRTTVRSVALRPRRHASRRDDQSKFFASRRDAGSSEVRRFACRLQALVDGGPKDLGSGCTSAK